MDTKFEIHEYYDIHIDDEDLAIAFSEAKQSYGPRPEDMSIEDYGFRSFYAPSFLPPCLTFHGMGHII